MSKFNYKAALASAQRAMGSTALEAIILGTSGAGKSFLLGSFGVPTLYLYSTGESHGPRAAAIRAQVTGSTIIPICMDLNDDGSPMKKKGSDDVDGDAVLERVQRVLNDVELFADLGIRAVALDGAAELETYIRSSEKWKVECKSANGKHNSYAEPAATTAMFRPIFNRLKELQRESGVHFAMTCMLDCKEYGEMNEIADASPRLKGFSVAEQLLQQFGDVLVVGPMKKNGETRWKIQFLSDLTKVSKDAAGQVKRAVNFNPRLSGVTPPPYLDADLRECIRLKENAGGKGSV